MLTGPGPWPVGLATAVAAGSLLWPIGARLGLTPASRAAAAALYACAALLVEVHAPAGVDGRGTLLLAAAAALAVGRTLRNATAVLLTAGAVAVSPITAAGFLVLLGTMALTGGVGTRLPAVGRRTSGAVALAAAVAVPAVLVRPGLPPALPPVVLGVLTLWTLLVTTLLWRRLRWLRPLGAALVALLACSWVPGPDAEAVVVVAAVVALLSALLAEEIPTLLGRRLVAVAVAAVAVGAVLATPGPAPTAPPVPAAARTSGGTSGRMSGGATGSGPERAVRPVSVTIPALGVAGPLEDLTADPDTGELAAPDDPSRAGWFAAGVVPGDTGPAVLGGHVDSRAGPGVFFGLRRLRPGDEVEIVRSDGRSVRFAVTAVTVHPKAGFPTAAVYGPTPGPELRLVTCGGVFDRNERSYRDNVVVDAVPADVT